MMHKQVVRRRMQTPTAKVAYECSFADKSRAASEEDCIGRAHPIAGQLGQCAKQTTLFFASLVLMSPMGCSESSSNAATSSGGGGASATQTVAETVGAAPSTSGTSRRGGGASAGSIKPLSSAQGGSGSTPVTIGGSGVGTQPGVASGCVRVTPSACTEAPKAQITEIDIGQPAVVNEDDANLKPLSISPIPSGGARVAWMGRDAKVHVTSLDCSDQVVSTFALPANDYGDIYADNAGGVLLVSREAQGGGTLNCGEPTNLCGTPPDPAVPCFDQYLVRFDGDQETWATKLTTSSSELPPYSTGPTGPRVYYVWWYAHHGRLAFDGTNWAAYYGAAVSVSEKCTSGSNTAINIHQGDEMRVVSPNGAILADKGGFDWGCSHSGFEKILWDPTAKQFASICRSDTYPQVGLNVNAKKLVYAIDKADSSVSNLVLADGGGYWVLVSNKGELHLLRFSSGAAESDISLGAGGKPHLVRHGNHLLATWVPASATNMVGQLLSATNGEKIGSVFPIDVPSNQYQDFRDDGDGSAVYVAPGSTPNKLKIVRVMPCDI